MRHAFFMVGLLTLGCAGHPNTFDGDNGEPEGGIIDPRFGDGSAEATGVVACSNGGHTTLSGTVYDPAGRNPLYNVYVYVPAAPLEPIVSGPVCKACQAPASGSPIVGTQTDPAGHFTLTDTPAGNNVPLVMQIGKFRRKIEVPSIVACTDNKVGQKDGAGLEMLTRLPRKQAESDPADNLPQIAVATAGCDTLECLLRKIGIDDSEFTDPNGRVRIFQGNGFAPNIHVNFGGASTSYSTDAETTLWSNAAELAKYDIVMNSCDCQNFPRGAAESTMHDYVDGGGRMFGTHYHYNWFAPPDGPADFQGTAQWLVHTAPPLKPFYIDTSFPKGHALDQWIQNVFQSDPARPVPGQIALYGSDQDVGNVTGATTRWIYYGSQTGAAYGTSYLSFNTPVGVDASAQCGRAVFSDLHVSNGSGTAGQTFPGECAKATVTLTQQEAALEFLFFDLSSCVGDDTKPPPPPPPN